MSMKPWHKSVQLRPSLESGQLQLKDFAADLHAVHQGKGSSDYLDPNTFFGQTQPTQTVVQLAKDVMGRLSGKNDKVVHVLEQTFGGGKTHSLVTLYHLA